MMDFSSFRGREWKNEKSVPHGIRGRMENAEADKEPARRLRSLGKAGQEKKNREGSFFHE